MFVFSLMVVHASMYTLLSEDVTVVCIYQGNHMKRTLYGFTFLFELVMLVMLLTFYYYFSVDSSCN